MKVFIGTDHAGFALKEKLVSFLREQGHEVEDQGAFSFEPEDDYPDYIIPVAEKVSAQEGSFGIILGGSGQGEAMCANRINGIRAAVFYGPRAPRSVVPVGGAISEDPYAIVQLEREHNNANVLALAARFISEEEAQKAVQVFLTTLFLGDERHVRRLQKF